MLIETLLERVQSEYEELTPQLRKVARFVIQSPTTVALSPLRKVAEGAGVSPTTLIRFATNFGFSGYEDFREPFRDSLRPGSERYSGAANQIIEQRGARGFDAVYQRSGAALVAQIEELYQTISPAQVAAAARAIRSARATFVLGLRSNFAAAFYFTYVTGMFQNNIRLVDARQGMILDEMEDFQAKDCLIAISFAPYPVDTVKSVRYAAEAGASIIAITDNKLSPIAERAAHTFVVPIANSSFYTSLIPTISLLEALTSSLLMEGGKKSAEKIKEKFSRLERLGAYWNDRTTLT